MLVLPADNPILNTATFVAGALEVTRYALQGQLVVFGIQPTVPETGLGYRSLLMEQRHALLDGGRIARSA
jgi:mannose-1-phosphate guanylyltransferase